MNLGDFKDELKVAIKRGDSYDDRLDGFVRRAARWIEQNYTLQYMKRRFTLKSVEGEEVIDLPQNVPLKGVLYLRFDGSDGSRYEMTKGDLSDTNIEWTQSDRYSAWPSNRAIMPSHFYLDGVISLVFNRPFSEVMDGQGIMAKYSDFPKAANQTHWLLQNAEGLLLRQAMLEFMVDTRDDRGFQAVYAKREEDIKSLMNAEFETQYTGQDLSLGG